MKQDESTETTITRRDVLKRGTVAAGALATGGLVSTGPVAARARLVIRDRGRGLSASDRAMIREGFTDALGMANGVRSEMEGVWNQSGRIRERRERRRDAWSAHADFVKWFGGNRRHILLRRVRRRVRKIRNWLDRGRIVVLAHDAEDRLCDNDAYALFPRKPVKVHLCSSWFDIPSESSRAAVIIHELVHQLGFGHPEGTSTRSEARALARSNSRKARRSPENYEHLYKEFAKSKSRPVKLQNERTGRCLNIHRGRHDYEGAPVTAYSPAETPDQKWGLTYLPNGRVKLKNASTGRCLNIHRGAHDFEGGPVTSYSCADTPDQQWRLYRISNGRVKLRNESTGRCLNIHGGRHDYEGAPVTSYSCADTPDQKWKLENL